MKRIYLVLMLALSTSMVQAAEDDIASSDNITDTGSSTTSSRKEFDLFSIFQEMQVIFKQGQGHYSKIENLDDSQQHDLDSIAELNDFLGSTMQGADHISQFLNDHHGYKTTSKDIFNGEIFEQFVFDHARELLGENTPLAEINLTKKANWESTPEFLMIYYKTFTSEQVTHIYDVFNQFYPGITISADEAKSQSKVAKEKMLFLKPAQTIVFHKQRFFNEIRKNKDS